MMRISPLMRRPVVLLAALLLTAGCLTPYVDRFRAGDVEEPVWNVGDWWTYEITSATTDVVGNVTVVVAEVRPDGYVLGIPDEAEANAALLFHMPAIGPVGRDLSWDVHETNFEPAQWPLDDGHSWDTTWIATDVHLTSRLNGTVWAINNTGFEQDASMKYELVYDPGVKWFTSFVRTGLDGVVRQSLQLTDSGTGYNGTLRAPQYVEVAFLESRSTGIVSGGLPAAPNPTFSPPANTDTLLVACLVGGGAGQYHAEVRLGDGVVCQLDETFPPGSTTTRTQILEVPGDANETWEARLVAGGPGSATAEVLAWRTLNFTL